MDFSWIGDFFKWCAELLPFHLGICRAHEGGVKHVYGRWIDEIRPGPYFHWPLVTRVEIVKVTRQPLNMEVMSETTSDDKTVHVRPVIIYEIADVRKALVDTIDYDQTAAEIAGAAVMKAVTTRKKEELRVEMVDKVPAELTREIRAALKKYGLYVIEARLSEMAEGRYYRTMGDGQEVVEEDDE